MYTNVKIVILYKTPTAAKVPLFVSVLLPELPPPKRRVWVEENVLTILLTKKFLPKN